MPFEKLPPRKAMFETGSFNMTPNIYSYADKIMSARDVFNSRSHSTYKGCTMKNTKGRDNVMYYISDNQNLEPQDDNMFDALMSLNVVRDDNSIMSHQAFNVHSQLASKSGLLGPNRSVAHASSLFNAKRFSEKQSSMSKLHSKANKETDYTSQHREPKQEGELAAEVSSVAKSSQPDVNGFYTVDKNGNEGPRRNEKG